MDSKPQDSTPKKARLSPKREDEDPFTPSRAANVDLDLTPRADPSSQASIPATPTPKKVAARPSNRPSVPSTPIQGTATNAGASMSSPLGASNPAPTPTAVPPPPPTPSNNDTVSIRVREGTDNGVIFRVKRTSRLEKVMNAYCQRVNKKLEELRFIFDGSRVEGGHTPASLEMDDNEIIDVVMEQLGGHQV